MMEGNAYEKNFVTIICTDDISLYCCVLLYLFPGLSFDYAFPISWKAEIAMFVAIFFHSTYWSFMETRVEKKAKSINTDKFKGYWSRK